MREYVYLDTAAIHRSDRNLDDYSCHGSGHNRTAAVMSSYSHSDMADCDGIRRDVAGKTAQSTGRRTMSEMIERVARALDPVSFKSGYKDGQDDAREMAREAIAAMRDPTDAMKDGCLHDDIARYQKMIDAALTRHDDGTTIELTGKSLPYQEWPR